MYTTSTIRYSYLNLSGVALTFERDGAEAVYAQHTGLPGVVRNAIKERLKEVLALKGKFDFRKKPVPREATMPLLGAMLSIQMALSATKHAAVVFPEEMPDDMLHGCALGLAGLRPDIRVFRASGTSAVMFTDSEVEIAGKQIDTLAKELSTTMGVKTDVTH